MPCDVLPVECLHRQTTALTPSVQPAMRQTQYRFAEHDHLGPVVTDAIVLVVPLKLYSAILRELIRLLARTLPATYVVFDLLYDRYRSLLDQPFSQRRERLDERLGDLGRPQVAFSPGIVVAGRPLFREACRRGLEGLVAKRLASRYRPGKRTKDWIKIKPPAVRKRPDR